MPSTVRRRFLCTVAALAGCGSTQETHTPTRNDTQTATATPASTDTRTDATATQPPTATRTPGVPTAADLQFVAAVVHQPSPDAPGRYRAALTNDADVPVFLDGDPLPVGRLGASGVDVDGRLVLFPEKRDSVNEYYWSHSGNEASVEDAWTGDCWVAPGGLVRTAAAQRLELPPGTTAAADFRVLGEPNGDCPSPGTYRLTDSSTLYSVRTHDPVATLRFRVDLRVRSDGTLTADGAMRVEAA